MGADAVVAPLTIVYRATNDFRFPAVKIDDGEEVGITANAAEWQAFEVQNTIKTSIRGAAAISQVTLNYVEADAGADYNGLQFLAELGSDTLHTLSDAAILGMLAYLGKQITRFRDGKQTAAARDLEDSDYEQHAKRTVAARYGVPYEQIQVEQVSLESNGAGSVSLAIPDGRRFKVDVEYKGNGLILHKMTRINPPAVG